MMNKHKIIVLIAILYSISIIFLSYTKVIADTPRAVNASFTTSNTAPGAPYNLSIQQYVKGMPQDFDYYDFNDDGRGVNIADTHYAGGRPPTGGPELNWSEGFDAEGNPVITQICITTDESIRNIAIPGVTICNVLDNFSYARAQSAPPLKITLPSLGFNQTGENRTYYIRMLSNDSLGRASGYYDSNVTIVNTRPRLPFNFTTPDQPFPSVPEAHSVRPWIEFLPDYNALDPDNGTRPDHWPGDNVTYLVTIQHPTGLVYLNASSQIDNSSLIDITRWLLDLSWGVQEIGGIVNATYNFTIRANDSANLWTAGNYLGQFNLTDFVPDILTVMMGDYIPFSLTDCDPLNAGCYLTPIRHSNVTGLVINVTTRDLDKDCQNPAPNTFKSYFHLCLNVPGNNCNEGRFQHNFTYFLDTVRFASPDLCHFNFTISPSPQQGVTPAFHEPPGMFTFYINATSQSGVKRILTVDPQASGFWNYKQLLDVAYIDSNLPLFFETTNVTVGSSGSITPGIFSPGDHLYVLYNYGNVIFDTAWNVTKFVRDGGSCGGANYIWTPDDIFPLQIDDDNLADFPDTGIVGVINVTGDTPIRRFYNYTTGVVRCDNYYCSNINLNETLNTYWHIKPIAPLCSGSYSAILDVAFTEFP